MLTDDQVAEQFYKRVGEFVNSQRIVRWRDNLATYYQMRDGIQWLQTDYNLRKKRRHAIYTFNMIAAIVRTIVGHNITNREKIKYFPRKKQSGQQVDMATAAVEYITDDNTGNGFYGEWSRALEDKLVCGLGFTDTYFSYRNPEAPQGEVKTDRLFPGYVIFDPHAIKTNLADAQWLGHFEIVSQEIADREKEAAGYDVAQTGIQKVPFDSLLAPFKNRDIDGFSVIYHYYYVTEINSYSVPRDELEPFALLGEDAFLAIQTWLTEEGMTLETETLYLSEGQMKGLRRAASVAAAIVGADIPRIKAKKSSVDGYFYARICDGVVLEHRPSINKAGHTIVARTCYYDEPNGCWTGVVKDMVAPQRAFNMAISDYMSYLASVPKGGMFLEEDAVSDLKAFKDAQAHEEDLTVVRAGAIAGGKFREKTTPQAVPGLDNLLSLARQMVYAVIGIDPSVFSADISGNATADLFGRQLRQSYKAFALAFDGEKSALRNQGKIFLECVRILAENNNGATVRRLADGQETDIEMTVEGLSGEYDVIISSSPAAEDERFEAAKSLIALLSPTANNPQAQSAVLQMIIEDYPFIDSGQKAKILQMMQPSPPPQPDPNSVALLQTQAQMQAAQARKAEAEAAKIMKETHGTPLEGAQELATLEKTQSEALKNYAAAGQQIHVGEQF